MCFDIIVGQFTLSKVCNVISNPSTSKLRTVSSKFVYIIKLIKIKNIIFRKIINIVKFKKST